MAAHGNAAARPSMNTRTIESCMTALKFGRAGLGGARRKDPRSNADARTRAIIHIYGATAIVGPSAPLGRPQTRAKAAASFVQPPASLNARTRLYLIPYYHAGLPSRRASASRAAS